MLQRIDVRNPERIRNQCSRRGSAPRTHGNAPFPRVADKIPNDQEIARELHLLDDAELARQSLFVVRQRMLEPAVRRQGPQALHPPGESLPRDVLEITVESKSVRNIKVRKWAGNFLQSQVAAFGNIERARKQLGRILEHAQHLVTILDVELRALELHPV